MSNIATTIEQSKHLLELGLDTKTADMVWIRYAAGGYRLEVLHRELFERIMETDIAAWSLTALLDVMPKPDLYREAADLWVCVTYFKEGTIRGFGETAIDAACDTITKMFERGYLKKKGGQDEND